MSEKILNVAIIGQGRSGHDIHGVFFKSEKNTRYKVVAAVDAIECRREYAKETYPCDVYSDYRELFSRDDIDLVVNSTFSDEHFPVTMDLINHGFNVVCEKPFAKYSLEVEKMILTAKEKGVMLNVFQQSRFAPYFEKMKEIIASGKLGRIVAINGYSDGFLRRWDWQTIQARYGGSMQNTGPHMFDQVLDLLAFEGDAMPRVFSRLDTALTSGDAEDFVKVILSYPGKPICDLEVSCCNAYAPYMYVVQGTKGSMSVTSDKIDITYFIPEENTPRPVIKESLMAEGGRPMYCQDDLKRHTESIDTNADVFGVAVKKYYDMIYDNLTAGKPMQITPEQVLRQVKIMEEVHAQNPLPVRFI